MAANALVRIEPASPKQSAVALQYLTFTLEDQLYAVPLESIREVIEYPGLTHIPLSPPVIPGVLNLRGAVVPVVDLRVRFGRPPTVAGRRTCVVIAELIVADELQLVGVLVDAVSEALEVRPEQLEPCPSFGTGLRSGFVVGMLNLEPRFVAVLKLEEVLSMSELAQLVNVHASRRERGSERHDASLGP